MWRTILLYGTALALSAVALNWLEYQVWARAHAGELYLGLIAAGFLGLGVWVGARAFRAPSPNLPFSPNTAARAALGITEREAEVLSLLAAGRSNKEIAQALAVSPNTIKTHVARLFEKLEASRRTEAILRARELGLIP
ncbi:MAG: response regulator transcription factor [Hyphomonadaceae bacterium]|nr:response regulator transcription factor [Hyphomonadaceae bacterium]